MLSTGTARRGRALTTVLLGLLFAVPGCDTGGGGTPARLSAAPSERSTDRPDAPAATSTSAAARKVPAPATEASRSRTAERSSTPADTDNRGAATTDAAPPEPREQTTEPAVPPEPRQQDTEPAAPAPPPPAPVATTVTVPAQPTTPAGAAAPTAAPSPAAATEPAGVGPFGWLLLGTLAVALLVGALLLYRSQRKSAWDAEAQRWEAETRTILATRLPPVLAATTVMRRGLTWPPVRDSMTALVARWDALTERAVGDLRRNWSVRVAGLMRDLVDAVDAETEAFTAGRDRTALRHRVTEVERTLDAVFRGEDRPEPPPPGT